MGCQEEYKKDENRKERDIHKCKVWLLILIEICLEPAMNAKHDTQCDNLIINFHWSCNKFN